MGKGRLEAFSDGAIAIIITIMVLELKAPHSAEWGALRQTLPALIGYILSFIYVGIYWNNHHNVFQAVQAVNGKTLWANLHLLFWLSLIPFATRWMSENDFATWPVATYGLVLLLCAIAWIAEIRVLVQMHKRDSTLVRAIGTNVKEWISILLYIVGIGLAFVNSWCACALYAFVAAVWFIPDRRIEREMRSITRPSDNEPTRD